VTWSLDFTRNPERIAALAELNARTSLRYDGTTPHAATLSVQAAPRTVLAGARFSGGPGREDEAREAWAFEMKAYFHRGVGEPPVITSYDGGVYTVIGLITTTHPGDHPDEQGIVWFT
jgi:hypothetical protein